TREHINVLPDDAVADVGRAENLRRPRSWQCRDLHIRARRDQCTINRDSAIDENISSRVEWTCVRTVPRVRVIAERPTESRDPPAFGANLTKKCLAETQIAHTLDGNLLCLIRQFVFARDVVAGDVPAFGASLLALHRAVSEVSS